MHPGSGMKEQSEREAREAVVHTARELHRLGLSVATTGNVSCRWNGGMLITPSARRYESLTPDDVVHVPEAGQRLPDGRHPSSEWRFHQAAYRARPDRHGVVHCHSPWATIIACAGRAIPPFHYMVTSAGGTDIPCVPYAGFGTAELAVAVATALAERDACLLAHHGQVAMGTSLETALDLAWIVEDLARVYHGLLQLGEVRLLDDAAVQEAASRMQAYRTGRLEGNEGS